MNWKRISDIGFYPPCFDKVLSFISPSMYGEIFFLSCSLRSGIRLAKSVSPAQVENDICAKYSNKFKDINTQIPSNGQGISGPWMLVEDSD
jgi:hypothetical protein